MIAVVVKLGNVKGKTLDDVDKIKEKLEKIDLSTRIEKVIKSQIDQAIKNPAEIKSSLLELKVNEVKVVIVGEVSNEAKARLKSEVKSHNIDIYDLKWVIDNFTDYYPQIFFGAGLLSFLEQFVQDLETSHWLTKQGLNLSDIYINPIVMTINIENFEDFQHSAKNFIRRKKLPFEELKKIIYSQDRILITGEAGTGKTGALSKILIDAYRDIISHIIKHPLSEKIFHIPIFIKCSNLVNKTTTKDEILNFIPEELKYRFQVCSILADGFDEIPKEKRESVIEDLSNLTNQCNSSLIVASRNTQINKTILEKFKRYELMPFELKQSIDMIRKLLKNKDKTNITQLQTLIFEKLPEIQGIIPLIPMSLILLVELVEEKKEIPASLTELYERYLELVLGKWDKEKGIEVLFDYQIKDRFLQELAYLKFYENKSNVLSITRKNLEEFVSTYRLKYNTWHDDNEFIKELSREGIINISEDNVSFRHRSFLDYFVGAYIFNNPDEFDNLVEFLLNNHFNPLWSDVVFVYFGKKRKINKNFLEKLMQYNGQNANFGKLISGRLLQAGWHTETELKRYAIRESIKNLLFVKNDFKKNFQKNSSGLSELLLDVLMLLFCEYSYNSTFLQKEIKETIEEKLLFTENTSILELLGLMASINRFIEPVQRESMIKKILDKMPELNLLKEEEVSYLIIMDMIEKNNKELKKTLRNRINKKLKIQKTDYKKFIK